MTKVCAIVVSYNPDPIRLSRLLHALQHQVARTVVVDNGSDVALLQSLESDRTFSNVSWIPLGSNLGVAKAQNSGIEFAKNWGADHVILFDHDSLPPPNLISSLLSVVDSRQQAGTHVAAVGPLFWDSRQEGKVSPFYEVRGLWLYRRRCDAGLQSTPTDVLISSGCLIPIATLKVVGGMREDLFIDYVDTEWCLRANAKGYRSYGVCEAVMPHELGDDPVRVMGKTFPMHSPLRHYYHFRNAIWLYRQHWVPLNWRLVDAWKLMLKFGFYSLFAHEPMKHIRMMLAGIWHGFTDRLGPWRA